MPGLNTVPLPHHHMPIASLAVLVDFLYYSDELLYSQAVNSLEHFSAPPHRGFSRIEHIIILDFLHSTDIDIYSHALYTLDTLKNYTHDAALSWRNHLYPPAA